MRDVRMASTAAQSLCLMSATKPSADFFGVMSADHVHPSSLPKPIGVLVVAPKRLATQLEGTIPSSLELGGDRACFLKSVFWATIHNKFPTNFQQIPTTSQQEIDKIRQVLNNIEQGSKGVTTPPTPKFCFCTWAPLPLAVVTLVT